VPPEALDTLAESLAGTFPGCEDAPTLRDCVGGTGFGDVSYTTRAAATIDLIVGFGHTIYPVDFRTAAQLERDRADNAAD
jgi:hypothetical protein